MFKYEATYLFSLSGLDALNGLFVHLSPKLNDFRIGSTPKSYDGVHFLFGQLLLFVHLLHCVDRPLISECQFCRLAPLSEVRSFRNLFNRDPEH